MGLRIALAGNPNAGKTTLFNALTGSNQFVGNWPGVTVEKKEGRLRGQEDVTVTDLPGIYSLSPYTPEELVTRDYLMGERPDAILNIVDGTNLERNLYLTAQLLELGLPLVVAVNMMDVVEKRGGKIDTNALSQRLGCPVLEISALKESGIAEATEVALSLAKRTPTVIPPHIFQGSVEHALAHIEERVLHDLPEQQQRWFAVKLFERDPKVQALLQLPRDLQEHIEFDIKSCEAEMDDDAESIVISQRYLFIDQVVSGCCVFPHGGAVELSRRIDRVVTHRILALPIFAVIMFLVYFLSVTTVGGWATDWAGEGLFGDGWHLLGIGSAAYREAEQGYQIALAKQGAFLEAAKEHGLDPGPIIAQLEKGQIDGPAMDDFIFRASGLLAQASLEDETGKLIYKGSVGVGEFRDASLIARSQPNPAEYGIWVHGIPVLLGSWMESLSVAPWLQGLVLDGIVSGVGSVLSFVPQMLMLFLFLAFLEGCGYMSRIAFILDQLFRRFGLSGKSFISMLIGTGCSVPGIMASRTIENERDRRMTVITTSFVPCGAKLPAIALIAGAFFGGAWWVAPSAYFVGIAAVLLSGCILKKTPLFSGEDSPFVMELPLYHLPTLKNVLRSMWDRGWSFIKKAGTIILLSSIVIWFISYFGWVNGGLVMLDAQQMDRSLLAGLGGAIAWLFAPLGWGIWQGAVAAVTGLVAKENIVGTFGIFFGSAAALGGVMEPAAAYSFLLFNLLCAPCFAAIGAIRQEMRSAKWFWIAVGYQTGLAYAVSLCVYQTWRFCTGGSFGMGTAAALAVLILLIYFAVRQPAKQEVSVG